jgi:hypothetical protein
MPRPLACLFLFSTLYLGTARAAEDTGPNALDAITALHKAGEYEKAAKAAQALVAARTQALGAADPETLRARMVLARITLGLGREAEAEAQLRELVPVLTRVFGADHREALASQTSSRPRRPWAATRRLQSSTASSSPPQSACSGPPMASR